MAVPTWPLPFAGRNSTGVYGQNFVWKSGNIYVMDNHRAAAWCWAQEFRSGEAHGLLHIDRHTDANTAQLQEWLAALPNGLPSSINDYLTAAYKPNGPDPNADPISIIRWDNYLPIYLATHGSAVNDVIFATHDEGDRRLRTTPTEWAPWQVLEELEYQLNRSEVPWVANLDLDYFFCTENEQALQFLSDDYVDRLAAALARLNRVGKLRVITIALTATDELTGGWGEPERLAERVCSALGQPFKLP